MNIVWRRSSHSGGVNNELCVELADLGHGVGVRDSKNPGLGHPSIGARQFGRLVEAVKRH
ncbi:uncharacterized protein DUF397 [Actinocorallia herbida]|uniref:Uncharacterized protein DUF397 n=2 Tax=Actinocorallia herbida TaxID=58109 RepID=A0A3N1CQF7_9ACTN|nr:DUF397 domain-containing protein [Actinocorallia herbida]ROO83549.1 uncharacterized protein DUF397 [Actinocorallia herbida]